MVHRVLVVLIVILGLAGADVARGTVLARTGRRFARAATAPMDGRLVHRSHEGDFYVAPITGTWTVRTSGR